MKRQQQGSLRETIITNRNEIHIRNKTRWPLTRYQSSVLFFFSFRNYNGKLFIFLFLFREKRNPEVSFNEDVGRRPFQPCQREKTDWKGSRHCRGASFPHNSLLSNFSRLSNQSKQLLYDGRELYIYIYLREEVLKRNNENVKNRWVTFQCGRVKRRIERRGNNR